MEIGELIMNVSFGLLLIGIYLNVRSIRISFDRLDEEIDMKETIMKITRQ